MRVTALIMAGGRGKRMRAPGEKPLLMVGGKAMIDRVVEAAKSAREVGDVIVAVSRHTPKTAERMRGLPVKVIETPGKGYDYDVQYVARRCGLEVILVIAADLPLITGSVLDRIVDHYRRAGKPALAVMVPIEVHEKLGLKPDLVFRIEGREVVPTGINVIDGRMVGEGQEQEVLVAEWGELAINVNTPDDLRLAEEFLRRKERGDGLAIMWRKA
ncbi:TPA: hypothetical protein EYP44_00635 [Candidatus Bathyarchaeota archaeon]|nr:hypothetical protein [Candidatus Bathyarchaeota archaeon]